jgi:ABC-type transport system substrate-binding protein
VIPLAAMGRTPGRHGGELRLLMAEQRDVRMMTIYGYTRLVVFDAALQLVPDILQHVEVEAGRAFTFTLREGHRWSDGHPLTTADFMYWWDDVANNARLSPAGPPMAMMPDGHPPEVVAMDEPRIRYAWPVPNPSFLPALAGAQPLYVLMPAHYLRAFHARHADPESLARRVRAARVMGWGALHELYAPARQAAFATHDPARANRLLDQAGLARRAWDGVRLLPDGRRAEITVETAGESGEETDAVELITENFRAVGIRLFARSTPRQLFRRRILLGETMLSVWSGFDNGIAASAMEPAALAPTSSTQFQWPRFGQYVETNGASGEPADMPEVQALSDLYRDWRHSETDEQRRGIWTAMLDIHAEQVFTIGIVNRTLQPVVTSRRLRNLPERGLFSFERGGFFGVHHMDAFWLDQGQEVGAVAGRSG